MKNLAEIKEEINSIIEADNNAKAELMKQVKNLDKQISECKQIKEKALIKNDDESFIAASQKMQSLEELKGLKSQLLNVKKPLIDDNQYNRFKSEILEVLDNANEQSTKKAIELAEEMKKEHDSLAETVREGNELLIVVQTNMYKDQDKPKNSEGKIIRGINVAEYKNAYETINFLNKPTTSYFYTEHQKGKKAKEDDSK